MILPTSSLGALLALVASLLLLGSWVSLLKSARPYRFEFFGFDFAFGLLLAAVAAAFTLGMLNGEELTFQDNLLLTGYRKLAWSGAAGIVFTLGNLLMLGGVSITGMAIAVPISAGLAIVIDALWTRLASGQGGIVLIAGGSVALLAAVAAATLAVSWYSDDERVRLQQAFIADPRSKAAPKKQNPFTGITLALAAGVLLGIFRPMLAESMNGENGVSAYGSVLTMAGAVLVASPLFVLFLMNFPVAGAPLQVKDFFLVKKMHHLKGVAAGFLFTAGLLAGLLALDAPPAARVSEMWEFALRNAEALVAVLLGVMLWKEFTNGSNRVYTSLALMVVLFLSGLMMIATGRIS